MSLRRTLEWGRWPRARDRPKTGSGGSRACGLAWSHCGVPQGHFCVCGHLQDLLLFYRNFLGAPRFPQLWGGREAGVSVLVSGKKG